MAQNQKDFNFSVLMDFYARVLTDKQREILAQYYDQDLSLAEIAENFGITRQGVRDAIKHGEAILLELEEKIGYAKRCASLRVQLDKLSCLTKDIRCANQGLFTPSRKVQDDTTEILKILAEIDAEEDADGI